MASNDIALDLPSSHFGLIFSFNQFCCGSFQVIAQIIQQFVLTSLSNQFIWYATQISLASLIFIFVLLKKLM